MKSNPNILIASHLKRGRRHFLKTSVLGGVSILCMPLTYGMPLTKSDKVKYSLMLDSPTRYFDGENCFVHARAGIVPEAGKDGLPRVVMTMSTMDLSGMDVFKATFGMQTDDLGKTWTTPTELNSLAPRYEDINSKKQPVSGSGGFCRHGHR